MTDLLTKIAILGVPGEGLKGQVGILLGSSWPLKGILRHLTITLPTEVNLRGVVHFFPACVGPGGPPGEGVRGWGLIN